MPTSTFQWLDAMLSATLMQHGLQPQQIFLAPPPKNTILRIRFSF